MAERLLHAKKNKLTNKDRKTKKNPLFSSPFISFVQQYGGYVFDPQIQRWAAARASYYEYFKPTAKNFRFLVVGLLIPVAGFMKLYWYENDWKEEQFTSGTIAYQDRKPPTDSGRP